MLCFGPVHGIEVPIEWTKRSIKAVKIANPPVIDGDLSDVAWEGAPLVTDFIDRRTDSVAKQPTFVRILYDNEYLYFAFECFEDMETIVATERKYDRERIFSEDKVQIGLDTFNNTEQAYMFAVTPIGTRMDSRSGTFGRNPNWDAPWVAKTRILQDRWVAEIAIPIGVMHFNKEDNQTWGMNLFRDDQNSSEYSRWAYNPNIRNFTARFGKIRGLDLADVKPVTSPELETYASVSATKRQGGDLHSKWSTGADLSMRLNSKWVSTFTANPDFGQVDADTDTIELRDTERFLPERRPFFKEGAEQFQTPIQLYNSRRISDIEVGAKLTGTGKDWTMAALDIQGSGVNSGDANFLVTRMNKKLTDDFQVGGMLISAAGTKGENIVASADTRYDLTQSITWDSQVAFMHDENDPEDSADEETLSEYGVQTEISGGTKPWFWEARYTDISEDFNPELGFISRRDIRGPSAVVSYRKDINSKNLESFNVFTRATHYQNHDGRTTLRDYFAFARLSMQNNWDFDVAHFNSFHDPYDNHTNRMDVEYNQQDRYRSFEFGYSWGTFQDVDFRAVTLEKPFKIGNRFTSELDVDYRLEDEIDGTEDKIWLTRLVNEYTFKWDGRVKLTVEQSSEDRYNRTLLFAYEDVGDWDFFLVLNDIESHDTVIRGIFSKFAYRW
jgi:hypothetical protein